MKRFHNLIPLHTRILAKVRFWFWWHFRATERQKCAHDIFLYGTAITKHGKRINPAAFKYDPK